MQIQLIYRGDFDKTVTIIFDVTGKVKFIAGYLLKLQVLLKKQKRQN